MMGIVGEYYKEESRGALKYSIHDHERHAHDLFIYLPNPVMTSNSPSTAKFTSWLEPNSPSLADVDLTNPPHHPPHLQSLPLLYITAVRPHIRPTTFSKLLQSIINHIAAERGASAKHGGVPELGRQVARPLVMLGIRRVRRLVGILRLLCDLRGVEGLLLLLLGAAVFGVDVA